MCGVYIITKIKCGQNIRPSRLLAIINFPFALRSTRKISVAVRSAKGHYFCGARGDYHQIFILRVVLSGKHSLRFNLGICASTSTTSISDPKVRAVIGHVLRLGNTLLQFC